MELKNKNIELNNTNFMYFEHYLNKELLNGHIQKIQMLDSETDYLKIKIRNNKENKDLIIGNGICVITELKTETKKENKGFSLYLNKTLINKPILEIKQMNLEKILRFQIGSYYVYFEFFSNNNIILTDLENKIILPKKKEEWKDRLIKKNEIYILPQNNLKNIFEYVSKKEDLDLNKNIVYNVIKNVNCPPILIEKIIEELKIDKLNFSYSDYQKIISNLREIYSNVLENEIIIFNNKENKKTNILNVNMKKEIKIKDTLNNIIDKIFLYEELKEQKNKHVEIINKKKNTINRIKEQQIKAKEKISHKIEDNKSKAALIYENYDIIENIRKEVYTKIKNKIDVKEIIKEINNKKLNIKIKEIDQKGKNIIFLIE